MSSATRAVYPHVVAAVFNRPWAIHPDTMDVITQVLSGRIEGWRFSPDEIEARLMEAAEQHGPREGARQQKTVAVLPMYGVITPRAGMLANASGGTSVESMRRALRASLKDPEVSAIVLDIDSPGGSVDGIPELAAELREAREQKPLYAVANTSAFSAAYWLGSQAGEFFATPSAAVGSIGVIAAHEDHSQRLAKEGIKPTYITSSPYKAEGNHAEPLSDEAKAAVQHDVDAFHAMFLQDVAMGRDATPDVVSADYGQGRVVIANDALERGMVDGIATMEQVVSRAAQAGVEHVAMAATHVVSLLPTFGEVTPVLESFAVRLDRVLGEVEAVAAHALERKTMRADAGRDLSAATYERLQAVARSLEALVAEAPAKPNTDTAVKVQALQAILKTYE